VIDAGEGVQENSRRHGYLLNLLGIRQVAVVVNKMDLVDYREQRFREVEAEYREWLASLGMQPRVFIPVAAKEGDHLAARSPRMPWWTGPTLIEALDDFESAQLPVDQPLRFVVQDVYRFDERRILAGRIESGTLKVDDQLVFTPGGKASVVKTIERWNSPSRDLAGAGDSIGVTLTEQIFVERGAVASHEAEPPFELTRLHARVFWMGRKPLRVGRPYRLKLATQETECEVESIQKVIDASTLATVSRQQKEVFVGRHEVGELTLKTRRPTAFDVHGRIPVTGRFVLVDGLDVCGGGIVAEFEYPRRTLDSSLRSDHLFWSRGKVTHSQRTRRNGHPGCVVWLTGLSGSGKSTLATELERELFNLGKSAYVLDGDNIRHGLCSDLGFAPHDRRENIRRVGEVAKLFADAGFICVTAFISPYREDRNLVRSMLLEGQFVEVHVNAPLEVCEQRDPKGLYAKARAQEIPEFTGISAPYEAPERPEIELRTDRLSVADSVHRILEYLHIRDEGTEISI